MAGSNTKEVGGICTPFTNAIFDAPGATSEPAGGGTMGGMSVPEGPSQVDAGELGKGVATMTLPGESGATAAIKGGKRPTDMPGS